MTPPRDAACTLESRRAGECYLDCWEYPDCPCGVREQARAAEEERARWAELQARTDQ